MLLFKNVITNGEEIDPSTMDKTCCSYFIYGCSDEKAVVDVEENGRSLLWPSFNPRIIGLLRFLVLFGADLSE
jgi:hypothetical protein